MIYTALIKELKIDFWERWANVDILEMNQNIWIYFLERECANTIHDCKTQIGQSLRGIISIEFIIDWEIIQDYPEIGFIQPNKQSPYIIAYAFIQDIIDEDTAMGKIKGFPSFIELKFEGKSSVNKGDIIRINGSVVFIKEEYLDSYQ